MHWPQFQNIWVICFIEFHRYIFYWTDIGLLPISLDERIIWLRKKLFEEKITVWFLLSTFRNNRPSMFRNRMKRILYSPAQFVACHHLLCFPLNTVGLSILQSQKSLSCTGFFLLCWQTVCISYPDENYLLPHIKHSLCSSDNILTLV